MVWYNKFKKEKIKKLIIQKKYMIYTDLVSKN